MKVFSNYSFEIFFVIIICFCANKLKKYFKEILPYLVMRSCITNCYLKRRVTEIFSHNPNSFFLFNCFKLLYGIRV